MKKMSSTQILQMLLLALYFGGLKTRQDTWPDGVLIIGKRMASQKCARFYLWNM